MKKVKRLIFQYRLLLIWGLMSFILLLICLFLLYQKPIIIDKTPKPELFKVTYYTLSKKECAKSPNHPAYGITKSGLKARFGVCAVDSNVIPLGSYVIDFENNMCFVALDTGNKVIGRQIDIFIGEKGQWKDKLIRPINYGYFIVVENPKGKR